MTGSEKLDLLLEKIVGMEKDMVGLRTGLDDVKKEVVGLRTGLDDVKKEVVGVKTEVVDVKKDMADVKKDMADVKTDIADIRGDIKNLQRTDILILDEVERVHKILNKHIKNQSIHTA